MTNQTIKRFALPALFLALAMALAFTTGYLTRILLEYEGEQYPILEQARALLETEGLKEIPPEPALEYGMIQGMLQAYGDPFTAFVEPAQHELQTDDLQGKFGGIGARLEKDGEGYIRIYPYPESPALISGILEGDRLVQVEDQPISAGADLSIVDAAIRGPVGKSVRMVVAQAPDFAPREVTVKREEISLPSVTWNLVPEYSQVGVIHVHRIAATTAEEIEKGYADLLQRGAIGFILDLRDNGGGLLDAGVDVARLFLREGEVISQQYRGEPVKTFRVEKPGPLADIPLAVLVNQNTASAAEIVAGALQVQGRAKLIGSPTYGKDTIQLVFDLRDGSSLHVTAARWWLPGKEAGLEGQGLQPDVPVDGVEDAELLRVAVEVLGVE